MPHFYTVNKFAWIIPLSFLLYPAVEIVKNYLSNYGFIVYLIIFILFLFMSIFYAKAIDIDCFLQFCVKSEDVLRIINLIDQFNSRSKESIKYTFKSIDDSSNLKLIGNYYKIAYLRRKIKKLLK
jgi:hypothetical protein